MDNDSEKYLENFLKEQEGNINTGNNNPKVAPSTERATELQYFTFDIKELPCGKFYPDGTVVLIRAAQTIEIQAYSMVDDSNIFDIIEKMNDMISACVRLKYADGTYGSYLDIKDGDRFYLIFVIRDLTFQKSNPLVVSAKCDCNEKNDININRGSFNFYDIDEEIKSFYSSTSKQFTFETINNEIHTLGIPSIGLQKSFFTYIINNATDDKKTNLNSAFLKIIPFTISNMKSIGEKEIKKKLTEFVNINDDTFQFLNDTVDKLKFGIKEIKTICTACGEEVHADFNFPDGASGLFIVKDAFKKFIKQNKG